MNAGELGTAAFAWVVVLGALAGAGSFFVFKRYTDSDQLRVSANRIIAHLMEIQLFADEPRLVLRAQWDLIRANGRILLQVALPSLLLLVPFAVLIGAGDLFFAHAPLRPGETALVTLVSKDSQHPDVRLEAPNGISVEGPPVWIPVERQLVWRVRATGVAAGDLRIARKESPITKSIRAGEGFSLLSRGRTVEIGYRVATIFHVYWLVWFCLSSLVCAGVFAAIS